METWCACRQVQATIRPVNREYYVVCVRRMAFHFQAVIMDIKYIHRYHHHQDYQALLVAVLLDPLQAIAIPKK